MIARQGLLIALGVAFTVWLLIAQQKPMLHSRFVGRDAPVSVDAASEFWRAAPAVSFATDIDGAPSLGNQTEVRSRWSKGNLYLLFICHYQALFLKPSPDPLQETNRLWNWDVAEAFIQGDVTHSKRYKEFEVSPQGEWVDLDIDLEHPKAQPQAWNSGFTVKASIDRRQAIWYGALSIPFSSITDGQPEAGRTLRINLFRCQGPTETRKLLAWQPTHSRTFHKPDSFGELALEP